MRLIRGFWKLLVGIKDGLVLLFMLLFFAGLFAALSMSPSPSVPSSGALLIALDGALVEQPAEADPLSLVSGAAPGINEYRLRDVVRALEAAATDSRAKAVVLDLDRFAGGGQATIAAAARAVDKVRASGKTVLAYATGYTDEGYQLAAHASEVWLDPYGAVLLTGPGGSRLYYKGLLDKLGVSTKVYRVGEFKSAVEPFIRTDQSPEARAANQALADALWASWLADVRRVRPAARIESYIARPDAAIAAANGDIAKAALAAGLVDRIGNRIAFGRRVAELAGAKDKKEPGSYRAIPLENWVAAHPAKTSGDAIGVLTIAGTIVDGEAPAGTAGGDTIAQLLTKELAKGRIKALVVRVDSPGGSVTGSERIRAAIAEARARKLPVIVSMGSVAASGGYWVATPGERIFADPATITGSIGVFGLLPTFQGSLDKLGLSADGVKTTPLSGEPDLYRGTSPEFDRLIQLGVEDIYRRFTGLVAQSRGLPLARVDQIAQGRVWAGASAKQIGLIDAYGSLEDAIAEAARRAKLDPAKVRPLYIEHEPNLLRKLATELFMSKPPEEEQASRDPWTKIAARPETLLARALADARSVAAGPAIQVRCLECPSTSAPLRETGLARALLERLGL